MFIFNKIYFVQFTLKTIFKGLTSNYVIHNIVVSFLATKYYHNLHEH